MAARPGGPSSNDRRVVRTRAVLREALLQLVEERDLEQLTVADITERAGVNRSTFYAHFADVHALAEAACTTVVDDLIESIPALDHGPAVPGPSLVAYFTTLAEHAGLYRSLLGPRGSARVVDHVRRRTMDAARAAAHLAATGETLAAPGGPGLDPPHDVTAAFTAGALLGVATDWLQRGCPLPPAEMARLTWPLLAAHYELGAPPPV